MNKEKFDKYRFTIKTRVLVRRVWHSIHGVDFEKRLVFMRNQDEIENVHYCDIEGIKESDI